MCYREIAREIKELADVALQSGNTILARDLDEILRVLRTEQIAKIREKNWVALTDSLEVVDLNGCKFIDRPLTMQLVTTDSNSSQTRHEIGQEQTYITCCR